MMPILTDEQRKAIAMHRGRPIQLEDPFTLTRYVLLELEVFERLQGTMEFDMSEPNPRDYYSAFADAVNEDLQDQDTRKSDPDHSQPQPE